MNLRENLKQAIANLRVNRMRTFLTMLGIIIGIGAVITITTLGSSLQKTLEMAFQDIGGMTQLSANVSFEPPQEDDGEDMVYEWKEEDNLTFEDLDAFQDAFSGRVKAVVVNSQNGEGKARGLKDEAKVAFTGVSPNYLENQNSKLLRGRDITVADNAEKKAVALVSDLFVKHACGGESPIGKAIDLEQSSGQVTRVYVVGVYEFDRSQLRYMTEGKDGMEPVKEKDISTSIYLPYLYAQENFRDEDYFDEGIYNFTIVAESGEDMEALQEDVKSWFKDNKWQNSYNTLETWSSMEELGTIQQVLRVVTLVIAVIAAISLLVGGVGVMNIMLVSVVERTREIGIRKALGAQNKDIERQFLSETIFICLLGGLLGVLLGLVLGAIGAKVGSTVIQSRMPDMADFARITVRPSGLAILVSVAFSMLTGLIFGLYPARRAARMSPIDALRYE